MSGLEYLLQSQEVVIASRLIVASILGGLIGLEREIHGRPAGFRTHLLVALGACLMMTVSESFFHSYGRLDETSVVRLDPARVAAQIVTGIGFLGAGAILKEGHAVRGLTTAACLWVVAGIGMAVGIGLYLPAMFVTAIALFNLLLLKRVERWLSKDSYCRLSIECQDRPGLRDQLEGLLERRGLRVIDFGLEKNRATESIRFEYLLAQCAYTERSDLAEEIADRPEVSRIKFH